MVNIISKLHLKGLSQHIFYLLMMPGKKSPRQMKRLTLVNKPRFLQDNGNKKNQNKNKNMKKKHHNLKLNIKFRKLNIKQNS